MKDRNPQRPYLLSFPDVLYSIRLDQVVSLTREGSSVYRARRNKMLSEPSLAGSQTPRRADHYAPELNSAVAGNGKLRWAAIAF